MEGLVGMIKLSLQSNPPKDWLLCDGTALPIHDHPELYALIGKRYGGDETHFHLPDLRGEPTHYFIKSIPSPEDAHFQGLVSQMVLWAGDEPPVNWFPCDGRPIIGAQYPLLQKVASTNQPTIVENFNLPLAPEKQGLKYIICMEGLDPTQGMQPTTKTISDDDY
jgi:microcystin-dependent protein